MSGKESQRSSCQNSRLGTPSKVLTSPNTSLNSSKLRDLSTARLERKRRQTLSQSRSSDNIETASKVHKVASAWSLMKQKYKARSAHGSLTEGELSSSAFRLVNVIKATSQTSMEQVPSKAVPISTKKILFKGKPSSPGRTATPLQGDALLTKLLQFTGTLSASQQQDKQKEKPTARPRPVIEVSFVPSKHPPSHPDSEVKEKPKEEKRKPRLIEVSMT